MRRKVSKDGKTETKTDYVRNCDSRDKYIKAKGMDAFLALGEKDEKWKELRDIPVPTRFEWLFDKFLQIWANSEKDISGNVIFTYRTINEYVECMKVPLTVDDKRMLLKMKGWAAAKIYDMEKTD